MKIYFGFLNNRRLIDIALERGIEYGTFPWSLCIKSGVRADDLIHISSRLDGMRIEPGCHHIFSKTDGDVHKIADHLKDYYEFVNTVAENSHCDVDIGSFSFLSENITVIDLLDMAVEAREEYGVEGIRPSLPPHAQPIHVDEAYQRNFDGVDFIFSKAYTSRIKGSVNYSHSLNMTTHCNRLPSPAVLDSIDFDSATVSAWTDGSKFGNTYVCRNGELILYSNREKDIRKTLSVDCDRAGIDFDEFVTEGTKNRAVDSFNLWSWLEWQEKNRVN